MALELIVLTLVAKVLVARGKTISFHLEACIIRVFYRPDEHLFSRMDGSIVYSDNLPLLDDPYYIMTYARSLGEGTYRMQYSSFFFVPGNIDWDASNSAHSRNFVKTPPGWRFLSTIEVGTDSNDESGEQWWISHAHSFLEQWYGVDGTALRAGLYGPGFVAEETGDFVQLQEAAFHHGRIENYKHVNAYSDDSGSVGLEMGGEVTRNAFNGHLVSLIV